MHVNTHMFKDDNQWPKQVVINALECHKLDTDLAGFSWLRAGFSFFRLTNQLANC